MVTEQPRRLVAAVRSDDANLGSVIDSFPSWHHNRSPPNEGKP